MAVLQTVIYADLFDYALTADEIHHYLIHTDAVSLAIIHQTLNTSVYLRYVLKKTEAYYTLIDRAEIVPICLQRRQIAQQMWNTASQYGRWLARLPFVRMVALTGALAVQNPPHDKDDYDYMLVTQPGRVWLARAFAVALVRLGKLRGAVICPNYVVAADALAQTRQDLFMAHEVVQMIPLYGLGVYIALRAENHWAAEHLPNATQALYPLPISHINGAWGLLKQSIEALLGGRIGDRLEKWEHRRKARRFSQKSQTPNSAAKLDKSQVKGHFNDHGHPILQRYAARLAEYHLLPEAIDPSRPALKMVGD